LHQISLPTRKDYFLIFHLFPTCSIQVANKFPLIISFFYERITQDGDQKGFNCRWGGEMKKEKNGGVGEGKDIVAIERFLIATLAW